MMEKQQQWIDQIFQNRVLSHVLFWLVMLASYPIYAYSIGQSVYPSFILKLFYLPPQILAAYLLIYYQIPRFVYTKKYLWFALSFVFTLFFFSTLCHIIDDYWINPFLGIKGHPQHSLSQIIRGTFPVSVYHMVFAYLVPFIMAGIKVVKQRLEKNRQLEQLQKEKAHAELQSLKAQIHPHFLFNTLENLYELSLKKSDAAPEVVVLLSEMLDYMLYECNEDKVPVLKEVELMQKYFGLEKLRYGNTLDLDFQYQFDDQSAQVAPLLLLSLIELSFKQIGEKTGQSSKMDVGLSIEKQQLELSILSIAYKGEDLDTTNINRQLELIYPDRYKLTIDKKVRTFVLKLNISL